MAVWQHISIWQDQFQVNLTATQVHVWSLDLSKKKTSEDLINLVSKDDVIDSQHYKIQEARNNFLLSRGFIRFVLSHYANTPIKGLQFARSANGKPFCPLLKNIHFNLSHTHNFILCAVSKQDPIGIDVEYQREIKNLPQLAKRFFTLDEYDELMKKPKAQQHKHFFYCWTRKEAIIKAHGGRLSADIKNFSVSCEEDNAFLLWMKDGKREDWNLQNLTLDSPYVGAIAVKKKNLHRIVMYQL